MKRARMTIPCPIGLRRTPEAHKLEWFLLGGGRERWATATEAAKINGVETSALWHMAQCGCPHSIRVEGRLLYYRACLGPAPACKGAINATPPPAKSPGQLAHERKRRQFDRKARRELAAFRREEAEKARRRWANNHAMLILLREEWRKSGKPIREYFRLKTAHKEKAEQEEAFNLGCAEMKLAGKSIEDEGAAQEAIGLGMRILAERKAARMARRCGG